MTTVDPDALGLVAGLPSDPASRAPDAGTATPSTVSTRPDVREIVRVALLAIPTVLAGFAVWFLAFGLILSGVEQHVSQTRLYDQFRLQLASETGSVVQPIPAGSPVAMISAPTAGIHNLVVVEGTTSGLLMSGPGLLKDTPLPGQEGNSVILGRSVMFGAPFSHITEITQGDLIYVTTAQGVFRYRFEDVRTAGSPLPPKLRANRSRLTLVTSAGGGWRSGWAPDKTVYVDALLLGKALPVSGNLPTKVTPASLPMHTDPGATIALIFWLEGLLLVAVAGGWAWARWGRHETWIVGGPLLVVMLWGLTDALMRFLPNLL